MDFNYSEQGWHDSCTLPEDYGREGRGYQNQREVHRWTQPHPSATHQSKKPGEQEKVQGNERGCDSKSMCPAGLCETQAEALSAGSGGWHAMFGQTIHVG